MYIIRMNEIMIELFKTVEERSNVEVENIENLLYELRDIVEQVRNAIDVSQLILTIIYIFDK